jgi:hypothetical protein
VIVTAVLAVVGVLAGLQLFVARQAFLVIPEERTELVRLKIARSPVLREHLAADNWHILKSNHVRRLIAGEEADLAQLEPLLGLDPEIEKQGEQLALFG